MKKIVVGLVMLFAMSIFVKGDLLGKIQSIDTLMAQGKYESAESVARKLLNDPNITAEEKASVQHLLNEIQIKKNQKKSDDKTAENIINSIIAGSINVVGNLIEEGTELLEGDLATEDTGTAPVGVHEDVSDGSKFITYNNYEKEVLSKRDPSLINQLSQLYFKDGLYERAVNLAKKDNSGDIRNLYVVAVGSRLIGKYDQSIDYYNRILAKAPGQAEAKLGLGIAYKSKGEYEKALGYLQSYNKTNGNSEVQRAIRELTEVIENNKKS